MKGNKIVSSDECQRELHENVDFPGTDIQFVYSPDTEHCRHLCTEHHACQFFTFIRPDWTIDNRHFHCYLKRTTSGKPNVQTPLLGVTSGFSLKPCSPSLLTCVFQVYQNVDFYGADYKTLFTQDYEECQRICTQDPVCQFFTFVNGDFTPQNIRYKCHLKFSWTVPRTPIVNAKTGVVSGFSHNIKSPNTGKACENKLFPSTEITGDAFETLPAASPEHCLSLCSAHPRCTFFSYVSISFSCQLKSKTDYMVLAAKQGVTSGLPARFCQLDNSWVKVAQEGVDFQGSDFKFVLLDDADNCQESCTHDYNCQFYTYVKTSFSDRTYWRRCYLKRVVTMPAPPKVAKLANVVSGFSLKNCVPLNTDGCSPDISVVT
ncbi:coagulation factor XI-like [Thalassophryne amazonica]|uniref:coagulation factor XI-like n=1 Tax=Thalassophryne amazonica TaxID=390379 RepID=UPI00147246A7|nr:coagulation factor XI-like [Thalassophryne amazonica]